MDCDFGKLTSTFQFSIKQESLPARVAVRCETADGKLSATGLAWRGVSSSGTKHSVEGPAGGLATDRPSLFL